MTESVLICSTKYGGCGYVGSPGNWDTLEGNNEFECLEICKVCGEDHMFQLINDNFDSLVGDSNKKRARELLDIYYAEGGR